MTFDFSGKEYTYFSMTTPGNACYFEKITITYEESDTPTKELVSLAISGAPTKTTYEAGEQFDPAGLVVTGTYSDASIAPITSGITWNVNPSPLTAGITSVSVTATVSGITSEIYPVNITVTAPLPKITITKTSSGITTSYTDGTFTLSDVTFAYKQWMSSTDFIQAKASQSPSLQNTTAIHGKITKIQVVTGSGKTPRAVTVKAGTTSTVADMVSITSPTTSMDMVFDFGETNYTYFCLSTPGNACYFDKIVITYEATTNPVINVESTEVNLAYNETSGSISYTISNPVDGVELEASLEEGATWITELPVGDESVTFNTTANDSYDSRSAEITLSYEGAEEVVVTVNQAGRPAPSITCANITDVPYEGVTDEEADVTFNNAEGWNPSIIGDGIVVTAASLSENTVTYSVSKNTGSTDREGSFTITLSKEGEEDVTKQVSVTQKHFVIDYAELPFSYDGGKSNLPTGLTHNGLGSDYSSSPKMKFDGEGDYLILKINENPGTLTFDIKGNPSTGSTISGTFTVQASIDGEEYIDVASYSDFGSTISTKTITDLASDVRYIKWIYTSKTSGNVALGAISLTKEVAKYTVTIAEGIQHGEIISIYDEYAEGATVQLMVNPDANYGLASWNITKDEDGSDTEIVPVYNSEAEAYEFAMPAYNITVSATFEKVVTYTRINNVDDLIAGKHYIILGEKTGTYYAMGGQNENNRAAVEIEATETTVQVPASTSLQEFTLSGDPTNNYTFYDLAVPGFLYAAGANSENHLKTEEDLDDENKGKWTITINDNSEAIIVSKDEGCSRNTMRFNSNNKLFSCYSSSSQSPVYLYMKENDINNAIYSDTYIDGDISGCSFFSVNKGAALTVTGTIDENIAMFSIVDGSQLIYDDDIPIGTIGNHFRKYADSEAGQRTGWNLVSVPIKEYGLLPSISISGNYDLYAYNEPTHFWINQKDPYAQFIQTAIGTGYLFAMPSSNNFARFGGMGTLQGSGEDLSFPLSYTETLENGSDNVLKGFNLVGNPFTCNAYVDMPFMVLDETGSTFISGDVIKPGDAILVQATETNQEITFTRNDATTEPESRLDINVSQNRGNVIDNARIRFNTSRSMNKFYLNENSTRVYIPQNGQEFAAVSTSSTSGEIPVSFKAEKNGTYTITVNTKNVDAEYLHLIDNMTGMDVDLLAAASTGSASYTFEAKTSDYASRFKLVFGVNNADSESSDSNFAYMSDGNLVIDNIEGQATLQIIDELGRVISTETVNGSYNKALNLKASLYIINLNGMTQKIVVK